MNRLSVVLCLFIIIPFCKCLEINATKVKKPLPHFRRQVEELLDDAITERSKEDANMNLVAFLVRNAKEIFSEADESAFTLTRTSNSPESAYSYVFPSKPTRVITLNTTMIYSTSSENTPVATKNKLTLLKNKTQSTEASSKTSVTKTTNINTKPIYTEESVSEATPTSTSNVKVVKKTRKIRTKPRRTQEYLNTDTSVYNMPVTYETKSNVHPVRSCIVCNNVKSKECNDPKQKSVSTVKCGREDDLCYSQQTPFGLIDRGCFNINLNMTTYVCACNLCNYISISEMPYIFSKRKDWLDNVIDLTRSNSFRTSIYKDMSCLSCEVNTTESASDALYNVNCLEGNIEVLSTVNCAEDEICGVKALRNDGYVWRGCLKSPLYNYWWSLCDDDFCNYEPVVSLYDIV